MSTTLETVKQAYGYARRGDRRQLEALIAEEATWHPASEGAWNPCRDGEAVLKTLMWRAGGAVCRARGSSSPELRRQR